MVSIHMSAALNPAIEIQRKLSVWLWSLAAFYAVIMQRLSHHHHPQNKTRQHSWHHVSGIVFEMGTYAEISTW